MKKTTKLILTLAFILAWGNVANAQSTIDFETVGNSWSWTTFETAPVYSVTANPITTGINTSANVGKLEVASSDKPWAGMWSANLGSVTFTSSNCIVKVMVYKNVISNFDLKFEGAGGLNFEKKVPNTQTTGWEELTFDFSDRIGSTVTTIVIIPDFPDTRTTGSINYFDNISFNAGTAPATLSASPVPTQDAANVLSIYSDAYTQAATGTVYNSWWNASWSNATLEGGGNAKKVVSSGGGGGGGIEFGALDVSTMSFIHMDIYPTTATAAANVLRYNVVPVGGGGAGWTSFSSLIANQWNSVNIPVSALALPGTSVFQVGFGTFDGDGTFYVDNVFFYKSVSTATANISESNIRLYPNPATDKLNINAASEIKSIEVRNLIGQLVKSVNANSLEKTIDMTQFTTGNYIVNVKLQNGNISTQKIVKL